MSHHKSRKKAKKVVIINGSPSGKDGNTSRVLDRLEHSLKTAVEVERIDLVEHLTRQSPGFDEMALIVESLRSADGFVFSTGTYWDSWGSPLQLFFEKATSFESSDLWIGKPAAVLVTMHSVGGKEVLSRLQGVLSTLGLMIPPMSGMVYSLANHLALSGLNQPGNHQGLSSFARDLWCIEDLDVIAANLVAYLKQRTESPIQWTSWPVDSGDAERIWFQSHNTPSGPTQAKRKSHTSPLTSRASEKMDRRPIKKKNRATPKK